MSLPRTLRLPAACIAAAVLALVALTASTALPAQQERAAPAEASGLTYRLTDG